MQADAGGSTHSVVYVSFPSSRVQLDIKNLLGTLPFS